MKLVRSPYSPASPSHPMHGRASPLDLFGSCSLFPSSLRKQKAFEGQRPSLSCSHAYHPMDTYWDAGAPGRSPANGKPRLQAHLCVWRLCLLPPICAPEEAMPSASHCDHAMPMHGSVSAALHSFRSFMACWKLGTGSNAAQSLLLQAPDRNACVRASFAIRHLITHEPCLWSPCSRNLLASAGVSASLTLWLLITPFPCCKA